MCPTILSAICHQLAAMKEFVIREVVSGFLNDGAGTWEVGPQISVPWQTEMLKGRANTALMSPGLGWPPLLNLDA